MSNKKVSESQETAEIQEAKKEIVRRTGILYHTFFLDVLSNKKTRPILIYASIVILLGAGLYHWLEGWSWLDSLYFVVITLTTIGYGDLAPTTPATKLITIFYGINGIVLLLMLFDVIRTLRGWEISAPSPAVKEQDEE